MSKRKRNRFDIEEKSHIIWRLKNGEMNTSVAKDYEVSHSIISTIWRDREKIKSLFEKNNEN